MQSNARALLAIGASLISGCATVGTIQTADTIGEGGFELGVEPTFWGVSSGGDGGIGFVQLGISGRFGVSDRTDLGFRVATNGGAEFLSKFSLTEPGSAGIRMALAPSGGGFVAAAGGGAGGILHFQLPLIIGIPVGPHQLVLTPKVHEWLIFGAGGGGGAGGFITSAGGSIGFSLAAGEKLRILPEFSAVAPLAISGTATGAGSDSVDISGSSTIYQVSFGFLVGKHRQ
jgi:hypothetical protein